MQLAALPPQDLAKHFTDMINEVGIQRRPVTRKCGDGTTKLTPVTANWKCRSVAPLSSANDAWTVASERIPAAEVLDALN